MDPTDRRTPPRGIFAVFASVVVEDAVPVKVIVVTPRFSPIVKSLLSPGPCRISLIRIIAFPVEIPEIAEDPAEVRV